MPTAAAPRGQLATLLLKDEATYGTAATGNYHQTLIYDDQLADFAPLEDDPILGTPRQNFRDNIETVAGLPQGVAGNLTVPLDLAHLWYWLKGAFGAPVTTGEDGDFSHVFSSGLEILPHRTIEGRRKSDVFLQRTGCLVNTIGSELSRRGGFDRATVALMGRKESNLAATGGGAPVAMLARDPVPAVLPVLKLDGVAAQIISLSWTYNNGATPQDYLGDPQGYPTGHDLDAPATFTGTIRARFLTDALYDGARAGTLYAMELLWAKSGTRSLSIAAPLVQFDPIGLPVSGPGRVEMSLAFRAHQSDTDAMLTATLLNGHDATEYA